MKDRIITLIHKIFRRKIFKHRPNMFTAYIIPNSEVAAYDKDNQAFYSRPDILRAGISFCSSAEEALKMATEDIKKDNIADLTKHTIFIEVGIGVAWADRGV